MNVSAITFRPGRVVGALGSGVFGGGGCLRQRGLRQQSIAGRTAARCTPQGSWRAVLSSGGPCWGISGHCWTRGSHPRAQKCRFCVKTTQNLGKIAHFDTKNPILCSKGGKTGEKLPFLTQKPRFCARKGRKWGFRRAKAHKNADFVLGKRGKWHREA